MKVVILAGGFGTRISEESHLKPKPMIEIGEKPILWHIMKEYSAYGINEFIICAGYKQHVIKEWFADYFIHTSDITFDFTKGNEMIIHNKHAEPWKVTVVDTGLNTQTGGRIKRVKDFVGDLWLPMVMQWVTLTLTNYLPFTEHTVKSEQCRCITSDRQKVLLMLATMGLSMHLERNLILMAI